MWNQFLDILLSYLTLAGLVTLLTYVLRLGGPYLLAFLRHLFCDRPPDEHRAVAGVTAQRKTMQVVGMLLGQRAWRVWLLLVFRPRERHIADDICRALNGAGAERPSWLTPLFLQRCLQEWRMALRRGLFPAGSYAPRQGAAEFLPPEERARLEKKALRAKIDELNQAGLTALAQLLEYLRDALVRAVQELYRLEVLNDRFLYHDETRRGFDAFGSSIGVQVGELTDAHQQLSARIDAIFRRFEEYLQEVLKRLWPAPETATPVPPPPPPADSGQECLKAELIGLRKLVVALLLLETAVLTGLLLAAVWAMAAG